MNICDKPLSGRTLGEAADCAGQAIRSTLDTFLVVLHSPASATIGDWGAAILVILAAVPVFLGGTYLLGLILGMLLVGPAYIRSCLPEGLTSRIKSLASPAGWGLNAIPYHMRGLGIPITTLIFGAIVTFDSDDSSKLIIGLTFMCVAIVIIALTLIGRRRNGPIGSGS